jgi:hypothetical protein
MDPNGRWYLDVARGDHALIVEWRPDRGFGVSTPTEDSFGAGPDEVYSKLETTWGRVRRLLLAETRTRPPEIQLSGLRALRGVTQMKTPERIHPRVFSVTGGCCMVR